MTKKHYKLIAIPTFLAIFGLVFLIGGRQVSAQLPTDICRGDNLSGVGTGTLNDPCVVADSSKGLAIGWGAVPRAAGYQGSIYGIDGNIVSRIEYQPGTAYTIPPSILEKNPSFNWSVFACIRLNSCSRQSSVPVYYKVNLPLTVIEKDIRDLLISVDKELAEQEDEVASDIEEIVRKLDQELGLEGDDVSLELEKIVAELDKFLMTTETPVSRIGQIVANFVNAVQDRAKKVVDFVQSLLPRWLGGGTGPTRPDKPSATTLEESGFETDVEDIVNMIDQEIGGGGSSGQLVTGAIGRLPKNLSVVHDVLDPAENKPSIQVRNSATGSSLYVGTVMANYSFTAKMAASIIDRSNKILAASNTDVDFQADGWDSKTGLHDNFTSENQTYFFGARHDDKMIAFAEITHDAANALSNLTDLSPFFSPFVDFVLEHVANYQETNVIPENKGVTVGYNPDTQAFSLAYTVYTKQGDRYVVKGSENIATVKGRIVDYGSGPASIPPKVQKILDFLKDRFG